MLSTAHANGPQDLRCQDITSCNYFRRNCCLWFVRQQEVYIVGGEVYELTRKKLLHSQNQDRMTRWCGTCPIINYSHYIISNLTCRPGISELDTQVKRLLCVARGSAPVYISGEEDLSYVRKSCRIPTQDNVLLQVAASQDLH